MGLERLLRNRVTRSLGLAAGLFSGVVGGSFSSRLARADELPVHAVVPAAAANAGAYGTYWGSDVALVNLSDGEGIVRVRAGSVAQPGGESVVASWSLPPGQVVTLDDILSNFPDFAAPGALFLSFEGVDPSLVAGASRTFTNAPEGAPGTLGQGLPLLKAAELYAPGVPLYAPLAGRDGFRTNLGLVNAGPTEASFLVRLHGEGGATLGETTVTLPSLSWRQQEAFSMVGVEPTPLVYASVIGQSGSLLWMYASQVDNATADPTTMPCKARYEGQRQLWIPAAAHVDGLNGTTWVTDVHYINPVANQSGAGLMFLCEDHDNYGDLCGIDQSWYMGSGEHRFFADVVQWLGVLNLPGMEDGAKGSLWQAPLDSHLLWSRTFNQGPDGTYGQELPGIIGETDKITGDLEGILVGLSENAEFRTNLGLLNTGIAEAEFLVELYDEAGDLLGTQTYRVPAMSLHQRTQVFGAGAGITNGRATVKATSGQGYAYASIVDNATGDPTTQYPTIITPAPNRAPEFACYDDMSDDSCDIYDDNGDHVLDLGIGVSTTSPYPVRGTMNFTDPDGDAMTYRWYNVDNPGGPLPAGFIADGSSYSYLPQVPGNVLMACEAEDTRGATDGIWVNFITPS